MQKIYLLLTLFILSYCAPHVMGQNDTLTRSYDFNDSIPENVLRSYLSRSIAMLEMCVPDKYISDKQKLFREDDERMILNLGAKHISRVIGTWGRESILADPEYFTFAKAKMERLLEIDPDLLFEGVIYECITIDVENIDIPAWVFEAFDLAVEVRKFDYESMLFEDDWGVDKWGVSKSIPNMSQQETRLWYYYAARLFIDAGIENIHYGNSNSTTYKADRLNGYAGTKELLSKVREYGAANARRGMVLINGNLRDAPDGHLLYDFITFASRIKELPSDPGGPLQGGYEIGYFDAIYQKTPGGITPSGWKIDRSLFLLSIDHTGISDHPGEMSPSPDWWVWGYDETTWYAVQPEEYRNEWLRYAWNWVRENDDAGYIKISGNKPMFLGDSEQWDRRYRANSSDFIGELGYNQEQTIKELWDVRRMNVHEAETIKSYAISSIKSIRFDNGEMQVSYMSHTDSTFDFSSLIYCDFVMNIEAPVEPEDTTSIKENFNDYLLATVYPNPFSDVLQIDCSAIPHEPIQLEIYSIQGKLVLEREINGGETLHISTSFMQPGIYVCKLHNYKHSNSTRIIKQ